MERQTDEQIINKQIDRQIDSSIDRQIDKQIDSQIDRQIDRQMDGWMYTIYIDTLDTLDKHDIYIDSYTHVFKEIYNVYQYSSAMRQF